MVPPAPDGSVEAAVTAFPGAEGLGAQAGFAAVDNRQAALEFVGDGGLERQVPLGVGAGAVGEQATLRKGSDLPRQALRCFQRRPGRHHAVHQADGERLVGLHRAPGEDQVQRPPLADDARQAHGAAVDQRHAEAPAEHTEHGVLGHHPQVCQQRQLQAAGHGMALDGSDQRLGQLHAARPHGPVAVRLQAVAPLAVLGHRRQVGTGAEGAAAASEHRHPRVIVRLESPQRRSQGFGGGAVDGVAHLRAVDDQGGDGAVLFDADAHRGTYVRGGL